jgi:HAMP domain-containing protein
MLEGESVAQWRWFRRGLEAPAAIDNHETEALARLMPATSEPHRFIAMAAPLRHDGAVAGVIGAQIDWTWVVDSVKALALPDIDLILLSRDGEVLSGPGELVGKPLATVSAQAAGRTATAALTERWPDGKEYFTVAIPAVGYADLPSFGWSLLVRQDAVEALAPTRELVRSFWTALAEAVAVVLALLYLAARWLTTPLLRLSTAAETMVADPYSGALHPETRFDEAARLRDALARLQAKLMAKAEEPAE